MLLLSQGCCFIQSLLFSYVLREDSVKFSRIYFGSLSAVRTMRSFRPDTHQCLEASNSSRLHPSGRNSNRLDALQSLRKSQCFSASVRTTWLYHSDAIQCLTRIRVSASRHSYGKTAATVRTMCDPVRKMSSIRQERAYQVQPSGRQPSWSGQSSFIYGNCVH
jgi:hypothetical protein